MDRLVPIDAREDLPADHRGTPVEQLFACHNLDAPLQAAETPQMLIATCMDHRVRLRLPDDFAYVLRTGGANLAGRAFEVSFAVAVGGVRTVAVVGHSDCGMAGVAEGREAFTAGLVEGAGWPADEAAAHFDDDAAAHAIDDPVAFTREQTARLRRRYPAVTVVPLHYRVEDRRLYLVRE